MQIAMFQNSSSTIRPYEIADETRKFTIFGPPTFDFIATFSSLFRGFWSMTFLRIGGKISREKNKNKK
jgi:hypothetical protein